MLINNLFNCEKSHLYCGWLTLDWLSIKKTFIPRNSWICVWLLLFLKPPQNVLSLVQIQIQISSRIGQKCPRIDSETSGIDGTPDPVAFLDSGHRRLHWDSVCGPIRNFAQRESEWTTFVSVGTSGSAGFGQETNWKSASYLSLRGILNSTLSLFVSAVGLGGH